MTRVLSTEYCPVCSSAAQTNKIISNSRKYLVLPFFLAIAHSRDVPNSGIGSKEVPESGASSAIFKNFRDFGAILQAKVCKIVIFLVQGLKYLYNFRASCERGFLFK